MTRTALHVDIVVDDHLALGDVDAVQPASVLGKRAFPRDQHGNQKGIETGIIETLAEIAPGRDNDAFLGLGNRGETRGMSLRQWSEMVVQSWVSGQFVCEASDFIIKTGRIGRRGIVAEQIRRLIGLGRPIGMTVCTVNAVCALAENFMSNPFATEVETAANGQNISA